MKMPKKAEKEPNEKNGHYYGSISEKSNNIIVCDRKHLPRTNGLIFGCSGSGKALFIQQYERDESSAEKE